MFGANKVYGVVAIPAAPLWVQAVFPTIQGEGPLAGEPCVFVRLGGCNLRCHFCDTDFESVRDMMSMSELLERTKRSRPGRSDRPLAVITGGEPMRQYIAPFCKALLDAGWRVQIETAGTVWPQGLEDVAGGAGFTLVCSPKTGTVHKLVELYCKHWKYIVRDGEQDEFDGLPNFSTQEKGRHLRLYRPLRKSDTIWLQPCEEYRFKATGSSDEREQVVDTARSQRNVQLAAKLSMEHGYRLTLQTHKIIGLP